MKSFTNSTSMRTLAFALLLAFAPAQLLSARGQEPGQDSDQGQELSPDEADLEAARTRLGELSEEELASKTGWKPALDERIQLLGELLASQAKAASLPELTSLEDRLAASQAALAALEASEPAASSSLIELAQLPEFEQTLSLAKVKQRTAQSAVDENARAIAAAREELVELPARAADARKRRAELGEEDELARFRGASAQIDGRVVTTHTDYLTRALHWWNALTPVLDVELALAKQEEARANGALELARGRAAELREEEERVARMASAEETRRAEAANDPVERLRLRLRSEVASLAADDTAQQTLIEDLKDRIAAQKQQLVRQTEDRETLEERLRVRPEGADLHLVRNGKRCEQMKATLENVEYPEVLDAQDAVQQSLAAVLDRQWGLRLAGAGNPSLDQFVTEMGSDRAEEAELTFATILEEEGIFGALERRQRGLKATSSRYAEITRLLARRAEALAEVELFISERMMWSRSELPISAKTFTGAAAELVSVVKGLFSRRTLDRVGALPGELGGLTVGVMVLLLVLLRKFRQLRDQDEQRAKLGPSLNILMWLRVLTYAAIPSIAIWIILGSFEASEYRIYESRPLETFLHLQALLMLGRRVARALLGPKGLAIGKWGAMPDVALQIYRSVRTGTWAGQLFYAPWLVLSAEPFDAVHVPRLLWVLYLAAMGLAMLRLLRSNGAVVQTWTSAAGITRLLVRTISVMATLMFLPVLLMDILGYRIGAFQYATNSLRVFQAVFILMGIQRVLDRTGDFLVNRVLRDRSGNEEDERKAATRKAGKALTQLASTVLIIVAALFLRDAWGIGAPTQRLLASLEIFELEAGNWLTGWEVTIGILWIVGGHLVVHNLSRLHDNVLVPFIGSGELGGRYAVLTLVRYATICLAYLAGLRTVGLDTGTLGWLLTGASVGLGFGMQEVVANFICGLILLFEQPIRVGDIISVGTTGGTINKITIRATVVTNWERQTLIIPNKTFITQNLINWTRNDQVMRRTLQVRVAYGTNMEQALQLIEGILVSHPNVLEDPPHRIWVQKFGEIGIELEVWFFASISDGLSTRSDVHAAILSRFASEGIEIPVITRDAKVAE